MLAPDVGTSSEWDFCTDLVEKGWSVQENYFPAALVAALEEELRASRPEMTMAGIGRGDDFKIQPAIRNDRTLWLDGGSAAQAEYLRLMDDLQVRMNRTLFLGLHEYECHFALYPPGGFYRLHIDALKGQRNRIVSAVTYLTPDWRDEDEGCLVLYDEANHELVRILPRAGTLALFMSEEIQHEVLPPRRARCSIAGWFRCNSEGVEGIDVA